jgi:hypothetical protein
MAALWGRSAFARLGGLGFLLVLGCDPILEIPACAGMTTFQKPLCLSASVAKMSNFGPSFVANLSQPNLTINHFYRHGF